MDDGEAVWFGPTVMRGGGDLVSLSGRCSGAGKSEVRDGNGCSEGR
jgi:hypothetical protein